VVYILLFWAGLERLNKFNWKVDPSYGIYLYAWPVQQVFSRFFNLSAYAGLLATVPIVVALGVLSFIFIERPSLNLAGRIALFLKSSTSRPF
jgi:peptidoglycan/LPS O-acetylase OafA/YrhL